MNYQKTNVTLSSAITLSLLSYGDLLPGARYFGIGKVTDNQTRTALRAATRPILPDVCAPDGLRVTRWELASAPLLNPDGILLELIPYAEPSGGAVIEWMLHTVRNRRRTQDLWDAQSDPSPLPDSRLFVQIEPITRSIGGETHRGYRVSYRWHSESIAVYKITERATWEIGGDTHGNELWWRSGVAPSVTRFTGASDEFYSSEWYLPGITNPNIFQFHPLQTATPGFLQTFADAGTLTVWSNRVGHVRSLVEKPRGKSEIAHWHELCGDLSYDFAAPPLEILWRAGGEQTYLARANRYEAFRAFVAETLLAEAGLRADRVTTYGTIEDWEVPDMARYAREGMPALIEAGVKTVMLCNQMQNNMNVWGVSNMCCTVDYQIPENVGEENIRAFTQTGADAGTLTEMWVNTALSTLNFMFDHKNRDGERIDFLPREGSFLEATDKAKARYVLNPTGAIEADHYTPVFAALNLRDPVVFDAFVAAWKRAYETLGIRGLFIDSSFNMSSDKWHFAAIAEPERAGGATLDQADLLGFSRPAQEPPAAMLSQYPAYLALLRAFQEIGYRISGEDLGLFTIARSGPGIALRLGSLPLWTNSLCEFDQKELQTAGVTDTDAVFFRGLSVGMMWHLFWNVPTGKLSWNHAAVRGDFDEPTAWQLKTLAAYNEAYPILCANQRELLPSETAPGEIGATLWRDPQTGQRVLWAWEEMCVPLERPHRVRALGENAPVTMTDSLCAKPLHVYLLSPA